MRRRFDPDEVGRLKRDSPADLAISGPTLAAHAFAAGLVDEVQVFLVPLVLAGGLCYWPDTRTPLVVLVDGGTMSSAELLAAALQDRNRAVLVGSRTFGKGTVQMPSEQPDGSVAELTVGYYATPSGRTVDEERPVEPDLPVEAGEDAQEKARTVLDGLAAGPG